LYRRLGGPQGRSGRVRKISPPSGFDPRTVQPVVSRYIDYTTRPTAKGYTSEKKFGNHSFVAIKTAGDAMGLKVSEGKSTYMIVKANKMQTTAELYITIKNCKLQRVHGFE
jgi:hypothetical protein